MEMIERDIVDRSIEVCARVCVCECGCGCGCVCVCLLVLLLLFVSWWRCARVCTCTPVHVVVRAGSSASPLGRCMGCNSAPLGGREFSALWRLIGTAFALCKIFEADTQVRVCHFPQEIAIYWGFLVGDQFCRLGTSFVG